MEKRVHLPLSAADHEAFNGAAHDARVSLAAWVRMACREKLCGKRTVADSIVRFEAIAPPVTPEAQEFAERIVPEMVEDASNVIAAPARKVPLPPSKRRAKPVALKEMADGAVVITTYPLTGIQRVRPSAPEIPDFEELMEDAPVPVEVTFRKLEPLLDPDAEEMPKLFPLVETGLNETSRPKFNRHPKCETEKCERLGPSCELCRLANTVNF